MGMAATVAALRSAEVADEPGLLMHMNRDEIMVPKPPPIMQVVPPLVLAKNGGSGLVSCGLTCAGKCGCTWWGYNWYCAPS